MKRSFIYGAFVLMIASAVNRIVGFIYQAAIYRLIGPEGIGLFNLVYPVYILIIVIATAGIPLGISKLVSEQEAYGNRRGSLQVLWVSVTILIVSGALFSLLAYLISPLLLRYVFINKMVYHVFLYLIPGIFIISVSSAFRGFFQGLMDMTPPAMGQVAEQLVRVCTGIYLATLLLPKGIQWAAAGMAAAGVIGETAGLLIMLVIFYRRKPLNIRYSLPGWKCSALILRKLFDLCAPITMGRIAVTLMLSINSVLIPAMLKKAGFSTSAATALYGQFTGVALTLLFIPSVMTVSLATSLVPAISEALAQNRPALICSRTREAIRFTVIAGVPFVTAYLVLPDEIARAVFGSQAGGGLLQILACGGIFAYLQQTTTGILQGLGRPGIPLQNLLIGGAANIAAIYLMVPVKGIDIKGCAYADIVFFLLAAGLNLRFLYRQTRFKLHSVNDIVKPLAAGILTGIIYGKVYTWGLSATGSNIMGVAFSLPAGFIVYAALIVFLGAVTTSDFLRLPVIKKIIGR